MDYNNFKLNILVVGKTEAGKSSFINYISNQELAKTGIGEPINPKSIIEYKTLLCNDEPVNIFNSWGIEIGMEKEFIHQLESEMYNRNINKPAAELFHVVVYCIQGSEHHIENIDINLINLLKENNYKVVVVLTKLNYTNKKNIKTMIDTIKSNTDIEVVIPISSVEIEDEDTGTVLKPFGKEEFFTNLDIFRINMIKEKFKIVKKEAKQLTKKTKKIKSKNQKLENIWSKLNKVITQYATDAFTIGFTPMPTSDALLLSANQLQLMNYILKFYSMEKYSEEINILISSKILTIISKSIVDSLYKLIPEVGIIAEGLINGSVASILTAGVGAAINKSCYELSRLEAEGEDISKYSSVIADIVLGIAIENIEKKRTPEDYNFDNK